MDWDWYKKITFGWLIVIVAYALITFVIVATIDYLPFVLTFAGLSFVIMIFGIIGFSVCVLDVFNQKEIHRLKLEIDEIDRVIDLKKKGIIP